MDDYWDDWKGEVMTRILILVFSLAMTMVFFGKSIIGIGMGLCVILSIGILFQNRTAVTKGDVLSLVKAKETMAIAVMFGIWLLSASLGIKPDKSIKEALEYIGVIFGGYIIFSAIQKIEFDFEKLFRSCVMFAVLCSGLLVLTPVMDDVAVKWGSSYGSVLTLFIPMAFYLTLKRSIWWVAMLVIASAIFASGGRTAWLTLAGLVIIMPIFMPVQKRIVNFLLVLSVVMIGAFAGLQSYKHVIGEEIFEIRTEAMQSMDRPASGRLTVWDNTIDKIMERPLLGYGIKSAQYLEISKGYDALVIHVHNVVLEMMLETGLLGFIAFSVSVLLFVGGFLRGYFRSNDPDLKQISMVIFLSSIAYGVCSMALTSMFHAWWFLYLVALVILLKTMELRLRQ